MGQPADKPLDARVVRSRARVLETAFALLTETGVGGFSVDEVARRSGVAKTTIYRHWDSREALIIDAASSIDEEQVVPDSGDPVADLITLLTQIGALLQTARWSSVVPSLIDVGERDKTFAALYASIQRGHADAVRTILARTDPDIDAAVAVSALMGPLYYRRWFSREPIDRAFVTALVRTFVDNR